MKKYINGPKDIQMQARTFVSSCCLSDISKHKEMRHFLSGIKIMTLTKWLVNGEKNYVW